MAMCRDCMTAIGLPSIIPCSLAIPNRPDITDRGGMWALCDGPGHENKMIRIDHNGRTQSADFWKERTPKTVWETKKAGHTLIQ